MRGKNAVNPFGLTSILTTSEREIHIPKSDSGLNALAREGIKMEMDNNVDITSFSEEGAKEEICAKHDKPAEPRAPKKKPKKKKKKHIVLWVVLGVLAALIISAVIIVLSVIADFNGTARNGDLVKITIKEGTSVSEIGRLLEEAGAIGNAELFRLYSSIAETDVKYQPGTFEFKNNIGYKEIAKVLMETKQFAEGITVTIPEGTGIYDYVKTVNGKDVTIPGIATLLENAGVCTKADFFAALDEYKLESKLLKNVNTEDTYCALEGYLFPDTYEFLFGDSKKCAKLAVERMIKHSEEMITSEMYARAEQMGYSMNEILTMASIIQLEAGIKSDEMSKVAAVFYNRLNKAAYFPELGSSVTIYYGSFYEYDDDRYCTQTIRNSKGQVVKSAIKGLPPGPICSPGIEAINAALYPEENFDKTYFVTDSKGNFFFSATEREHNSIIKALQNGDNWIYETYK